MRIKFFQSHCWLYSHLHASLYILHCFGCLLLYMQECWPPYWAKLFSIHIHEIQNIHAQYRNHEIFWIYELFFFCVLFSRTIYTRLTILKCASLSFTFSPVRFWKSHNFTKLKPRSRGRFQFSKSKVGSRFEFFIKSPKSGVGSRLDFLKVESRESGVVLNF